MFPGATYSIQSVKLTTHVHVVPDGKNVWMFTFNTKHVFMFRALSTGQTLSFPIILRPYTKNNINEVTV